MSGWTLGEKNMIATAAVCAPSVHNMVVETPDDGPLDHVRAGMAAEQVWLAATDAGLAGSLLTQPFQLSETRAGLEEALSLGGFPQLLLRFGQPTHHA
jgi:hypothetical protein